MIDQVLAIARKELGYKESPAGSNRTKYGQWYGMNGGPWCAMFVSWVFHHAGYPLPKIQIGAPSGGAYCPYFEAYARRHGQWHPLPKPGDLALFHFGQKTAIHIGIVEKVKGTNFYSIEGNTGVNSNANGGAVMRRFRHPNLCRGFYRPISQDMRGGKDAYYRLIRLRSPYMSGNDVREWQKQVNFWGLTIDIDGVYGPESEKACRVLQEKWGLDVDGIVGPKTWARTFLPSSDA